MIEDSEYWKSMFEKAMTELEKTQLQMFELSNQLRELEIKLLGGPTK
jgi:tRNA(Phe) wybutosine-synthesizing methylase Tyw3